VSAHLLQFFCTPERLREARALADLRLVCIEHGISSHQTARLVARARKSLRTNAHTRPALLAVSESAKARGVSQYRIVDAFVAACEALSAGRSAATAYQAGVAAMRPQARAHAPSGGAA
jgi:hypothetical protein